MRGRRAAREGERLIGLGLFTQRYASSTNDHEDKACRDETRRLLSQFAQVAQDDTMKLAIVTSLVTGAAAFAPSKVAQTSTSLNMAFENELGAQPPLGFFDPLGLVADGDQEKFDRLRGVEIKHGRICMLGVVGYLVNKAGIYLPGDISTDGTKFSDLGSGWDASFAVPVPGALQVLAFCGALELAGWQAG